MAASKDWPPEPPKELWLRLNPDGETWTEASGERVPGKHYVRFIPDRKMTLGHVTTALKHFVGMCHTLARPEHIEDFWAPQVLESIREAATKRRKERQ